MLVTRSCTSPCQPISVVIADDDDSVRAALTALLDDHPSFVVAGAAGSGPEAARLCAVHQPVLAVVDVVMPGGGEEAIGAIHDASAVTLVVMHTARSDRTTRDRMLAAGALAVLIKGSAGLLTDGLLALVAPQEPEGKAGPSD